MNRIPSQTKRYEPSAVLPSVHWAQRQNVDSTTGGDRRLYDFEIMYVSAGEMIVHFPDSDSAIVYLPGDLLFLNARETHRIEIASEEGARLIGIHFDFFDDFETTPDVYMVVDETNADDLLFAKRPVGENGESVFAPKYSPVDADIVAWMERICDEFTSEAPGFEMACRGAMLLILASLERARNVSPRAVPPAYRQALSVLADEISADIGRPWTNARLARELNIGEDHFIRLFKAQYGVTPSRHIRELRHREAKKRLRETGLSIEQIGRSVGYDDLHHFSHAFKKWEGVSPREYRNRGSLL